MSFQVKSVIDGNTFTVTPSWKYRNIIGDIVYANGYQIIKQGRLNSKDKLTKLVLGKDVVLKKVVSCKYGCLFCDVYIDGKSLTSIFTPKKPVPVAAE